MKLAIPLLMLALTGCKQQDRVEAPTPAETERLDQAEEMLNDLANEEGPAPESAGPSDNLQ